MAHNNNDNSTLLSPCPDNGKFAKVFVLAVLTEPAPHCNGLNAQMNGVLFVNAF